MSNYIPVSALRKPLTKTENAWLEINQTQRDEEMENTPELWFGIPEEYKYVTVNSSNGELKKHKDKPWYELCVWMSFESESLSFSNPLAQFALQRARECGCENSLVERPENNIKAWVPGYEERYYLPSYFYLNYKTSNIDSKEDRYLIKNCLAFKEKKHAEWVAKHHLDPAVLQAALAIDGLASYEEMLDEETWIISNFCMNNETKVWLSPITEHVFDPKKVNFKSKEKAEQALKVILPNGRTLENHLHYNDNLWEAMK